MEETSKHALQQEELRLIAALSAVRTKLNEFALISSLPSEVLENIFGFCVSWLYDAHKPSHGLAWTEVCRKWRLVSLNAPLLWSTIDLCNERFASLCLRRCVAAPIHLFAPRSSRIPTRKFLPEHIRRIRSIDVYLFPDDLERLFVNCGPELEHLTSLSLRVPPIASDFSLDLATRFPNLRRLTMQGVRIPYGMCVGLTHLSLCGLIESHAPTVNQLLSILEASPYIEQVNLEHITLAQSDTNDLPLEPIRLIHLSRFSFTGKAPDQLKTILSYVTLPPTSHLIMNFCTKLSTFQDIFPTNFLALYCNADLIIDEIHFELYRLFIFTNPNLKSQGRTPPSSRVPLITITNSNHHMFDVFITDFPLLFPTTITSLSMPHNSLDKPSLATFVDFFSHLSNLETLTLPMTVSYLSDIVELLSKPAVLQEGLVVKPEGVLCHKLKCIRLLDSICFPKETMELFSDLARARSEAGFPVELLRPWQSTNLDSHLSIGKVLVSIPPSNKDAP